MQYKITDRQINKQQQLCKDEREQLVYFYRDFAKTFSCKCIHETSDPCEYQGEYEFLFVIRY